MNTRNATQSQLQEELKVLRHRIAELEKSELVHAQTEEALRESEERFQCLSDAAEEGIAIHNNGVIVDANEALARMFGYELSELIGKRAETLASPDSWKTIKKYIATGYDKPYEATGIRKDGSTFHCHLVGKPYQYKGKTLRVAAFRDITELKKAEEALRQSEAKWRTLVTNAPEKIALVDCEGIIRYNNRVLPGRTTEEVTGTSIYDYAAPGELSKVKKVHRSVIKNRESRKYEAAAVSADGNIVWFENSVAPIIHDGKVVAAIYLCSDITERKRIEQALRASEERYRKLVETSPEAMALTDLQGNLITANERACNLYGFDPGEGPPSNGINGFDFIVPEERPRAYKEIEEIIKTGKTITAEHMTIRKDGTRIPVEISSSVLPGANGEPEGFILVIRDLTERKKAEEELQRALKKTQDNLQNWRKELNKIEQLIKKRTLNGSIMPMETFVSLTINNIVDRLSDLKNLTEVFTNLNAEDNVCRLLNCPRLENLMGGIKETIDVLETTKSSFKSKELAKLRQKLEELLEGNAL